MSEDDKVRVYKDDLELFEARSYELSVAQLGEILLKAGQTQTAIWNENRPTRADIWG